MARKTKGFAPTQHFPTEPSFVWVRRANMYCKTWFDNGKQNQQWLTKEEYVGLGTGLGRNTGQHQNTQQSAGGK